MSGGEAKAGLPHGGEPGSVEPPAGTVVCCHAGLPPPELGRRDHPADVAYAAVYLASDEAAWVTGVCLPVDGGESVA